jgi:hypothetical protein
MDPEFEIYGSRFRWVEENEQPAAAPSYIPLLRRQSPLPTADVEWLDPGGANKPRYGKLAGGFVYRFEGTADFWVAPGGSSVEAFFARGAQPWDIEFVLSRGVLPRVLHLRGITSLHASAVILGGKVVAFSGASGTGKSTIAAALAARGCQLVSDDVLPLRITPADILAGPGLPELRLYPSAAARLGIGDQATAPRAGQYKAVWRPEAVAAGARPVACIHLLQAASEGPVSISPASPKDALLSVLSNSFWLHPGETRALAADLACFSHLVRSTPIYHLRFDLGDIDSAIRLILSAGVATA